MTSAVHPKAAVQSTSEMEYLWENGTTSTMSFPPIPPALRKRLLALALVALALWIAFFDSHSILRRIQYTRQLDRVKEENEELIVRNEDLEQQIDAGLTPERVEKVAREQYGMRRQGETVYPVESPEAENQ